MCAGLPVALKCFLLSMAFLVYFVEQNDVITPNCVYVNACVALFALGMMIYDLWKYSVLLFACCMVWVVFMVVQMQLALNKSPTTSTAVAIASRTLYIMIKSEMRRRARFFRQ